MNQTAFNDKFSMEDSGVNSCDMLPYDNNRNNRYNRQNRNRNQLYHSFNLHLQNYRNESNYN